jgi:hypothetical protein
MKDTIAVFISSKHSELEVERSVLADKIRSFSFLEPVVSEEWPPQRSDSREVYLDKVRRSPIYVGIFHQSHSHHTELEYRTALENQHRELLLYVKESASSDVDPELANLLDEMRVKHILHYFRHLGEFLPRFGEHLGGALVRMMAILQKLGEPPPTGRSHGSVLNRRWLQERARLAAMGLPSQPEAALAMAANIRAAIQDCETGCWQS